MLLREPLLIDASATHCREERDTTSLFVIIHARFRSRTPYAHTYANLFVLLCTIRSVSQALSRPSLIPLCLMSFSANDELFCPICDTIYATANSAFVLSCADDGCKGHLCFDCLHKESFPATRKRRRVHTAGVPWQRIHMRFSGRTSPCRNCRIKWAWPRSR